LGAPGFKENYPGGEHRAASIIYERGGRKDVKRGGREERAICPGGEEPRYNFWRTPQQRVLDIKTPGWKI